MDSITAHQRLEWVRFAAAVGQFYSTGTFKSL